MAEYPLTVMDLEKQCAKKSEERKKGDVKSNHYLGIRLSPVKIGGFRRFFRLSFERMLPDLLERLVGVNDKTVCLAILSYGD